MEPWKDHYDTLGVTFEATAKDIKKAFYQKMADSHPDAGNGKAGEERCKEYTNAYETLSKPTKRMEYDSSYHIDKRTFEEQKRSKRRTSQPPPRPAPEPEPKPQPEPGPEQSQPEEPIYEEVHQEETPPFTEDCHNTAPVAEAAVATEEKPNNVVANLFREIVAWFGRSSRNTVEIGSSMAVWFGLSWLFVPQIIFCLPYILYAQINTGVKSDLGGAYFLATFVAAPLARGISAFWDNRRVRNLIVFPVGFYIISSILISLLVKFVHWQPF